MPGLKREKLLGGYKTKAVRADVISARCNGKWITVGISVDAINGMVLSIDELPGGDAEQLQAWLEPILDTVDADVVVSDDENEILDGANNYCECAIGWWIKERIPFHVRL